MNKQTITKLSGLKATAPLIQSHPSCSVVATSHLGLI